MNNKFFYVISGFRCEINKNYARVCYFAASSGNKPEGRSSKQMYLLSTNLEIYWRFCKSLKLVLVLGQLNTVCIFPSLPSNSILILSSHLSLGHLVASFFLSGFLTDILCADLIRRFFIPVTFFLHLAVTDIVNVKEGKLLRLPY